MGQKVGMQRQILEELPNLEAKLHDRESQLTIEADVQNRLREKQRVYDSTLERLRYLDIREYQVWVHVEGGRAGRLLAWLVRPQK